SAEDRGQRGAGGECRVAVGGEGGDEDLASYLAELQDLQSACRQPPVFVWLVGRKGGLSVAGAGPQLHAVWAGRGEYGGFDERRGGRPPPQPRGPPRAGPPTGSADLRDARVQVRPPPPRGRPPPEP